MNWINLDSAGKLNEAKGTSKDKKILILKYSSKGGVDYVVKTLLEREWNEGEMRIKTYLVDTEKESELAKQIEGEFGLSSDSPQVVILENSKPVFTANHGRVIFSEIRKYAN